MQTRKRYSKEFKQDAISLVLDQGYSRAEAARNLGSATVCGLTLPAMHCVQEHYYGHGRSHSINLSRNPEGLRGGSMDSLISAWLP
jgi:hypothetical protein